MFHLTWKFYTDSPGFYCISYPHWYSWPHSVDAEIIKTHLEYVSYILNTKANEHQKACGHIIVSINFFIAKEINSI